MQYKSPVRPLVVIPTYNERDNIALLIPAVLGEDSGLHILVVDDGSPDDTAGAVLELKSEYSGRVFLHSRSGERYDPGSRNKSPAKDQGRLNGCPADC